jgi:hypothetical protein
MSILHITYYDFYFASFHPINSDFGFAQVLKDWGYFEKNSKNEIFAPNSSLNQNANRTIWKLVSRASQWVPMSRGSDKLLEFSLFLFSRYGQQHRPQSLKG